MERVSHNPMPCKSSLIYAIDLEGAHTLPEPKKTQPCPTYSPSHLQKREKGRDGEGREGKGKERKGRERKGRERKAEENR